MNTKTKAPIIAMTGVKSHQIESIGHCPITNTLAVKFIRTPATYHYPNVTAEKFAELQKAESLGSYVHNNFVKSKHPFTKIEPEKKAD